MSQFTQIDEAKELAGPTRSEVYDAIVSAVRSVYDVCREQDLELWHEALFVAEQIQKDAQAEYETGFIDGANDVSSGFRSGYEPDPHFEVRGKDAVLIYPDHTERV